MTARQTVRLCSGLHQTLGPSWVLSFESCQIYQPCIFPCLSVGTSGGKQIHSLPCSLHSQNSELLQTRYARVETVFCSVQQESEIKPYVNKVLTLVLIATLVGHNVGHQPSYPRDTESKDTLCFHPWSPRTSPNTLRSPLINHLCSWKLTIDSKWPISFICTECPIGIEKNYSHYLEELLWNFYRLRQ